MCPDRLVPARTLAELKAQGWRSRSVRDELRANLIAKLRSGQPVFPGLVGYDRTVIPAIQKAILSRHDFILLGLRGQAKTRILRALPSLLDEVLPILDGSELNDDPFAPISPFGKRLLLEAGDDAPIAWLTREDRYREKLATPDVSISDLIGDIDPVKAATRKLDFADEGVIHYGIIPRTNRGLFAINELPDLQARIQVGLLNILEEGDIQIRGFPLRLPLDTLLVFSANPEDYTNRGNIITPLRDRIASQILTHYPRTLEEGMAITAQEAWVERAGDVEVLVPAWMRELVDQVAFEGRQSEFIDQNSGISARMTISLLENLVSGAERRAMLTGATQAATRVCDLFGALSAITGKVELVYEGEREGAANVALHLLGRAVKTIFDGHLPNAFAPGGDKTPKGKPDPNVPREADAASDYAPCLEFFRNGATLDVSDELDTGSMLETLSSVSGLEQLAQTHLMQDAELAEEGSRRELLTAGMEFILEGLHQSSLLSKQELIAGRTYSDPFDEMAKSLAD